MCIHVKKTHFLWIKSWKSLHKCTCSCIQILCLSQVFLYGSSHFIWLHINSVHYTWNYWAFDWMTKWQLRQIEADLRTFAEETVTVWAYVEIDFTNDRVRTNLESQGISRKKWSGNLFISLKSQGTFFLKCLWI